MTELVIQTVLHPTRIWITVPLTIAGRSTLDMVLDTGSPATSISEPTLKHLQGLGLVSTSDAPSYVLRGLTIQGQAIPDMRVRVSARATQVGADGLLGITFLGRFTDVHFHVPTGRLTLTGP